MADLRIHDVKEIIIKKPELFDSFQTKTIYIYGENKKELFKIILFSEWEVKCSTIV